MPVLRFAQAAAAVILPIAIQTAMQLDLTPRTFAMGIAVAALVGWWLAWMEPRDLSFSKRQVGDFPI